MAVAPPTLLHPCLPFHLNNVVFSSRIIGIGSDIQSQRFSPHVALRHWSLSLITLKCTAYKCGFCLNSGSRSVLNRGDLGGTAFQVIARNYNVLWPRGTRVIGNVRAFDSESEKGNTWCVKWDLLTEQISASATIAFLLLQLPQIILNARNLMTGNNTALSAVPWTGLLTGLLGNLSLLSYFAGKKERGAMIVQAVGVLSTFVVLLQLVIAGAMPVTVFIPTTVAVVVGVFFNYLYYNSLLNAELWRFWQEIISIGGVSVLPQVMWTTFEPYVPPSLLPGSVFLAVASFLVFLGRLEKLPKKIIKLMGGVAAWSATLLFMWGPVAQMWTNFINPSNIKGLSVFTILLAMMGNSLLLPRALFTRDLMWFTGSSWGALMQGWGILLTMYINKCVSGPFFLSISCLLALWLGNMLVMDSKAHSLVSPLKSLAELISGQKSF